MTTPNRQSGDPAFLDAVALGRAFRDGVLSPVEVAAALLDRISRLDPHINAIVHVDRDYTIAMARLSEARHRDGRPLSAIDGVPTTIKDLAAVAGLPLRRGSAAIDRIPQHDAPCVARLREAGAVFLAKTATPDSGCKVVTRSALHGVTANPYDPTRTPGGSSGGAAAALAMGFGPLAVGSDGAGSLRIPASSTNTFALKPGFGRVPQFPPGSDMPMSVSGPMARTVMDAALMLDVMSRPDSRDPFGWPIPFAMPEDLADPDLSGLRIAYSARLGCTAPLVDPEVDSLVAEAATLLTEAGAHVSCTDPQWPIDPLMPFQVFWETGYADLVNQFDPRTRDRLDPVIREVAALGRARTMTEIYTAINQRLDLSVAARAFFSKFDLLVGPVMPVPPYAVERDVPEGFGNLDWHWCPYTYPFNLTGQPAASVPIGFTATGLPVGVQIIGDIGQEAAILRAAAAIERRRPLHERHPAMGLL